MQQVSRLPLSPSNSNIPGGSPTKAGTNKPAPQQRSDANQNDEPAIEESPVVNAQPQSSLPWSTKSRIPRATADTPRSLSYDSNSKIPRPFSFASGPALPQNQVSRIIPPGFQAYNNPSFDADSPERSGDVAKDNDDEPASPPFAKQLRVELDPDGVDVDSCDRLPAKLLTPEALAILRELNSDANSKEHQGVRNLMNAFLRTGPELLSPEPNHKYTIRVPPPAAVLAPGILNFSAAGGEGVYGAIRGYLRTGAAELSPEPGRRHGVPVPAPMLSVVHAENRPESRLPRPPNMPAATPILAPIPVMVPNTACSNAVDEWLNEDAPNAAAGQDNELNGVDEIEQEPFSSEGENEAAGVVDEGDKIEDDERVPIEGKICHAAGPAARPRPPAIVVAAPVNSGGLAGQDLPSVRGLVVNQPLYNNNYNDQRQFDSDERPAGRTSRRVSPVAFNLPPGSSGEEDSPASAPPAVNPRANDEHPTTSGSDGGSHGCRQNAPGSGASFSFGLGGGGKDPSSEQPTCNPNIGPVRPDTGGSVQQPNPFAKMLQHLQGHDYASPAKGVILAQGMDAHPESSPQSPQELTPLHLLSHGTSPPPQRQQAADRIATPELGHGDLNLWIERRSLAGAVNSPALRDLARLWSAAGERWDAIDEAEALRRENEELRMELEQVNNALRALGEEHAVAVVQAQAGSARAEAEAARAQEAAETMKRLAHQIQAAFGACELENRVLVEQLGDARQHLAQVEARIHSQDDEVAAQLAASRTAAQHAEQEARAAREQAQATAAELEAIRQELAAARAAKDVTPVSKLQTRLADAHRALRALHQGEFGANTPEIAKLLAESENQLTAVAHMLRGGLIDARERNAELRAELQAAHQVLAERSPCRKAPSVEEEQGNEAQPQEVPMTVDYRDFQQALGLEDSPETSPTAAEAAQNAPSFAPEVQHSANIVVDGMLVTNVPQAAVNKVKNMVQFFETLGDAPSAAPLPPFSQEEVEYAVEEAATVEQHPLTAVVVDVASNSTEEQIVEPVKEEESQQVAAAAPVVEASPVAPQPSPEMVPISLMPRGSSPEAAAQSPSVNNDNIFSSMQAVEQQEQQMGGNTPQSQLLLRSASAPITPLSLGALRGRTGEEMRAEVRARLNRLKADLQAAQRQLKNVDRDLMAYATPPPQGNNNNAVNVASALVRRASSSGDAIITGRMTPDAYCHNDKPISEVVQRVFSNQRAAAQLSANDENTVNGQGSNIGMPISEAVPLSCRRRSVRFAPSVKGSSDDKVVEHRNNVLYTPIADKPQIITFQEPSPREMVGSTMRPDTTARRAEAAAFEALYSSRGEVSLGAVNNESSGDQSVAAAAIHGSQDMPWWLMDRPSSGASQYGGAVNNNVSGNTVAGPNGGVHRNMRFDSDSEDDDRDNNAPGTDTRSRFAMAEFAGVRGLLTPGVSRPTPQAHRHHHTPSSRALAPPMASPSVFSSTSSFSPPEPVALLAIRPLVGRVRRGAGPASARRAPSETEEKEFRRRAAALRIHVSPYFNRKEGPGRMREGDSGL